jgi:hypothetical protein
MSIEKISFFCDAPNNITVIELRLQESINTIERIREIRKYLSFIMAVLGTILTWMLLSEFYSFLYENIICITKSSQFLEQKMVFRQYYERMFLLILFYVWLFSHRK